MITIKNFKMGGFGSQLATYDAELELIVVRDNPVSGIITIRGLKLMKNADKAQCSRHDGLWTVEPSSTRSEKDRYYPYKLSASIREELTDLAAALYDDEVEEAEAKAQAEALKQYKPPQ
jgi:hypothetical protein